MYSKNKPAEVFLSKDLRYGVLTKKGLLLFLFTLIVTLPTAEDFDGVPRSFA